MTPYVPEPGDIVWPSFDPQAGHEQAGTRPALVVSRASFNQRTGFAWFCPITSQRKGYPFEVALPPEVTTRGVILSDQCKSLDWTARRAQHIERAPAEVLERVRINLHAILAMP